jgi:2-oxoglutarate ferredoxin oxidoreductase subunit delta
MAHIVIDDDRCKSCYICVNTCPKHLIKKSDRVSKLGDNLVEFVDKESQCIGCAMCATRCPDMAIIEVHK